MSVSLCPILSLSLFAFYRDTLILDDHLFFSHDIPAGAF